MEERVGGICDGAIPYKDFIHYDSFPFQSLMISSRQSGNTLGVLHTKETEISFSMMGGRGEGTSRKQGGGSGGTLIASC